MTEPSAAQLEKLKKWSARHAPPTQWLADGVIEGFAPVLMADGLIPRGQLLRDPGARVTLSELAFECADGEDMDCVDVQFDKWGGARFQVHMGIWNTGTRRWVRQANLVVGHQQFYHGWGKPWWWPARLWSRQRAAMEVGRVVAASDQIFRFLRTGERGANISAEVVLMEGEGHPRLDLAARRRSRPMD